MKLGSRAALALLGLVASGCGGDEPIEPTTQSCVGKIEPRRGRRPAERHLRQSHHAPAASEERRGVARTEWCLRHRGRRAQLSDGRRRERERESGRVGLERSASASTDTVVQGIALDGTGSLGGATGWLSNGFLSPGRRAASSRSGHRLRKPLPSTRLSVLGVTARSWRDGWELSWTYTFVGGGASNLFAGALSERRFRVGIGAPRSRRVAPRLGQRRIGERSGPPGAGRPWYVECGTISRERRRAGATPSTLAPGAPRDRPQPVGTPGEPWGGSTRNRAVRDNASIARDILTPVCLPARRSGSSSTMVGRRSGATGSPTRSFPLAFRDWRRS